MSTAVDDIAGGGAMVGVNMPDGGAHWVVVDGIEQVAGETMVAIRDPYYGVAVYIPFDIFASMWQGTVIKLVK